MEVYLNMDIVEYVHISSAYYKYLNHNLKAVMA